MSEWAVTLKYLRDNESCFDEFNKLVCILFDKEYDQWSDPSLYLDENTPIEISYILEKAGLDEAIWACKGLKEKGDDLRAFACWCAQQVEHLDNTASYKAGVWVSKKKYFDAECVYMAVYFAREAVFIRNNRTFEKVQKAVKDVEYAQQAMFIKMLNGEAPWQRRK